MTQESPMKQHVDITLKLSLWLDATMDEDDIVTHVRASLPKAFGEELTAMKNPVDIISVRQEAEIYGTEQTASGTQSPAPWSHGYSPYTDRDGNDIPAYEISDAEGNKVFDTNEDSPAELQEANACLGAASPRLLAALVTCANLLADHDEAEGEEGDAYREAVAAINEASGKRS